MTPLGELRPDQHAPNLRVCVGCASEWYSDAFYSEAPARCAECGLPLLQTLTTTIERLKRAAAEPELDPLR